MKSTLHTTLPAFTIIESLVAMVLVLISFGVGILSFNQLSDGDQIILTSRTAELVNNQMTSIVKNGRIENPVLEIGAVTLLSEVIALNEVQQVSVVATSQLGLNIYSLKTYVANHEWNEK